MSPLPPELIDAFVQYLHPYVDRETLQSCSMVNHFFLSAVRKLRFSGFQISLIQHYHHATSRGRFRAEIYRETYEFFKSNPHLCTLVTRLQFWQYLTLGCDPSDFWTYGLKMLEMFPNLTTLSLLDISYTDVTPQSCLQLYSTLNGLHLTRLYLGWIHVQDIASVLHFFSTLCPDLHQIQLLRVSRAIEGSTSNIPLDRSLLATPTPNTDQTIRLSSVYVSTIEITVEDFPSLMPSETRYEIMPTVTRLSVSIGGDKDNRKWQMFNSLVNLFPNLRDVELRLEFNRHGREDIENIYLLDSSVLHSLKSKRLETFKLISAVEHYIDPLWPVILAISNILTPTWTTHQIQQIALELRVQYSDWPKGEERVPPVDTVKLEEVLSSLHIPCLKVKIWDIPQSSEEAVTTEKELRDILRSLDEKGLLWFEWDTYEPISQVWCNDVRY